MTETYFLTITTKNQNLVNEIAEIATKKDYHVNLELDIQEDGEVPTPDF